MPIETVEAGAWRHLDVAREAIDLERTRRLQALAPGESISFIDTPPPPPASPRQAQSAGTSADEVQAQTQTQTAAAPQIASARQVADALQAHMHALLALNLHPFGGLGGGATALLASFEAATSATADAASNAAAMISGPTASTDQRLATEVSVTEDNAIDANSDGLIDEAVANHREDGNRIDEGSFYGSESRGWEAEWDARLRSYDDQYNALSTFRGSVSQGYLDYVNEMTLLFLQQPSWDDFVEERGLRDEFPLSNADHASADDGFDLNFDGLTDQAAGISEAGITTPAGIDATQTPDASAQVGITERDQQGIDQSDDIQYQRLEEQAGANGTSGRLPDGRFQTADGRIVTNGSYAVTNPAQESGRSSAYTDEYVHVGALPGVWPQGALTPAPDLPALPAVLTPTLLDGRAGTGVPYRDQAGQIFYETFDADGKAVGLRSVSAAATPLPLADLASTAAPLILTGLTAEASYGPWPFRVAAVATLAGATWLTARGTDGLLNREALDPERVRDDQLPLINVPVSPGPAGTPGYVADNRDTSMPGYEVANRPLDTSTTTPIVEQSWEDLIVEASAPKWTLVNGVPYRSDLAAHLTGPDGFKGGKLFGSHNLEVATSLLQGSNYWLTPTGTPGILELNYDYLDPSTGTRTVASPPKTVYDPAVISDQAMMDAVTRAGDQAWASYTAATGIKPVTYIVIESGIKFQVYINTDQGNAYVGNVHPIK